MKKRFAVLMSILIFLLAFFLFPSEKYRLDAKMAEFCKKDGGIKIYETVILQSEMFDRWGYPFPGWRARPIRERLGPDYQYIKEIIYLKQGDPFQLFSEGVLSRSSEKIIRKNDGKLLGTSVSYGRTGGEAILIGHPSGKICPDLDGPNSTLIRSVFLKARE